MIDKQYVELQKCRGVNWTLSIANRITIGRIILVPIFIFFLLSNNKTGYYISTSLFTFLALTDGIDGYIARKFNEVSDLGKILDPLADKLLVISAMVGLVGLGKMKSWMAIMIIARELIVTTLRVAVSSKNNIVIAADKWGKIKTLTQILAVVAMLTDQFFSFSLFGVTFTQISQILTVIAVCVTVISGFEYVIKYRNVFK